LIGSPAPHGRDVLGTICFAGVRLLSAAHGGWSLLAGSSSGGFSGIVAVGAGGEARGGGLVGAVGYPSLDCD
jgi:hypothetical protein